MSESPHQLGAYRIEQEIGRGGMAVVYRATDARSRTVVALKVLPQHLAADVRYLQRFEREGKSAARLQHPHIVRTFEAGSADGYQYMAMQFVQGQTLAELLRERRSLMPFSQIVEIVRQVAEALDYAHGMGVLHRDIKNSNIMIDRQGNALLMDFGVAKLLDEDHTEYTVVGTTVGTPAFMAPEQARGGPVDRRADIYSLGVIAYTLFTGAMPFKADSQPALLHKIVYEPPLQPEELNPQIPAGVLFALKKVLAKSPSARYATASEFALALVKGLTWNPSTGELRAVQDRMLVTTTSQNQVAVTPPHKGGSVGVIVVGVGALVSLAAALLLLFNPWILVPAPSAAGVAGPTPAPVTAQPIVSPPLVSTALALRVFRPAAGDFQIDVPANWVAGVAPFGPESIYTFDAPDRMARVFTLRLPLGTAGDGLAAAKAAVGAFWAAANQPYAGILAGDDGVAKRRRDDQPIYEQSAGAVWMGRPVSINLSAVAGATNVYLVGTVAETPQAEAFASLHQAALDSLRIDTQPVARAATSTPLAVPSDVLTVTPPASAAATSTPQAPVLSIQLPTPTPSIDPLDARLTAIAATLEALNGPSTPSPTVDPLNAKLTAIAATLEVLNETATPGP